MSGRTRLVAMAMATAVALGCLPASAQELRAFYTGNDLWSRCSGDNVYQSGLCQGFGCSARRPAVVPRCRRARSLRGMGMRGARTPEDQRRSTKQRLRCS